VGRAEASTTGDASGRDNTGDGGDGGHASDAADASDARKSCADIALDAGDATVCAMSADASANLVIQNNCAEGVDLWWVGYQCSEVFYSTIQSGAALMQPSFVSHPWRLRLPDAGPVIKQIGPLPVGSTVVVVP
jgi:hypothetical protein